jgi:hypothetical protein
VTQVNRRVCVRLATEEGEPMPRPWNIEHLLTGSLEVPTYGPERSEFYFGQGSVLLEGHPSTTTIDRGVQCSQPT